MLYTIIAIQLTSATISNRMKNDDRAAPASTKNSMAKNNRNQ